MGLSFDPTVKKYLELINQPPAGSPVALPTVEGARKGSADIRYAVDTCEMASIHDVSFEGPHGNITIRVFTPKHLAKGENQLSSGMVYIHGGGWVIGTLDAYSPICSYLAEQSGSIVISVDYRLAPEYKFPIAHDEVIAAWEWIISHAPTLGVDPERISLAGDSAGANMATVCAIYARERGGIQPKAQFLFYPVTDQAEESLSYARVTGGVPLTAEKMRWYTAHYLNVPQDGYDWRASPLKAANLSGLPQTFIVTLGLDPLCDEGVAYAKRLQVAGVPVNHLHLSGMIHGFLRMAKVIWASAPVMTFAAALQKTI